MKARILGLDFLCNKEKRIKALQPKIQIKGETWPSPSHTGPSLAQMFQELWLHQLQQLPTTSITMNTETPGTNTQSLRE